MVLPTLILIHGAWHMPSTYKKIIPILESKGYKCIAPQMKYSQAYDDPSPATPTIEHDVRTIQSLIQAETSTGKDVVLLGHSFGGLSSCSALNGLDSTYSSTTGKVIGLIEIAAFICPGDTGLLTMVTESLVKIPTSKPSDPWNGPDEKEEWTLFSEDIPGIAKRFYADIPAEEGEALARGLQRQSHQPFKSPKGVYAGWKDVPVWYLACTEDRAIAVEWQRGMVQMAKDAGADVTVREMQASHSPFFSRPEETVDFIVDAVNDFSRQ